MHQYEQARQLDPTSAEAHSNLALALHKLGKCDESLTAAQRAVALAEHAASSHMTHGKILAACGRMHEALAAFERVLAIEPERSDACYNQAWVLAELGRVEEADKILAELVKITGIGSDADVLLRSLRARLGMAHPELETSRLGPRGWMLALNARLQPDDNSLDISVDRAKINIVMNDWSREQYGKARQGLEELLAGNPASDLLHGLSAMLWQLQGEPQRANAEMRLAGNVFQEHE